MSASVVNAKTSLGSLPLNFLSNGIAARLALEPEAHAGRLHTRAMVFWMPADTVAASGVAREVLMP